MLASPNEPLPGQGILAADMAAIIRYGRHTTARSGPRQLVRTGSGGQTRAPIRRYTPIPLQLSANVSTPQPFQVISFVPIGGDTTGDSGYMATLQPGMINGDIFPQVSGTPMWQFVATTTGGVTTYAFPTLMVNKGDQIYLQATVTAGVLTDVNIYSGTPPAEDDSTAIYEIANLPSSGATKPTQITTGNKTYQAQASYWNAGSRLIYHDWGSM